MLTCCCLLCVFSSAYTLDGVNLKGYFAYALNDQRDPGFGLYGQVQEEVIVKASLANYRNIIQHNGFPIQGAAQQQCPSVSQPCLGCQVLVKRPVLGFLILVGSGVLITLGIVIYYTAKRHKERYWRRRLYSALCPFLNDSPNTNLSRVMSTFNYMLRDLQKLIYK